MDAAVILAGHLEKRDIRLFWKQMILMHIVIRMG